MAEPIINNNNNNDFIKITYHAFQGTLTVEEVNQASDDIILEKTKPSGFAITLLNVASMSCPVEVIEAIINRGVDINGFSSGRKTALMSALNQEKWDNATLLLSRGADVNVSDMFGISTLHFAVMANAPVDIIKLIIKGGADPTVVDGNNCTALEVAKKINNSLESVEYLEQVVNPPLKSANLFV
jgi:ankyrin repeat protein